jgi:hypothetical protein
MKIFAFHSDSTVGIMRENATHLSASSTNNILSFTIIIKAGKEISSGCGDIVVNSSEKSIPYWKLITS